jgi:hypothetical protein
VESPKSKHEVLNAVMLYEQSLENNGDEDKIFRSILGLIGGFLLHSTLFIITLLAKKLHLWTLVSSCAKLRIKTDKLSAEPIQCGLNKAYTNLGLAKLHQKDIYSAIEALHMSSRVWPCPHNTTFGLSYELVKQLKNIPEAYNTVEEYKEIASAFTKSMDKYLQEKNTQ